MIWKQTPWGKALLLALLMVVVLAERAPTAESPVGGSSKAANGERQDEIWFVSTRGIRTPDWRNSAALKLDVRHFTGEGRWRKTTLEEFHAGSDPEKLSVIYLHGNRIEWSEAFERGWCVYHSLLDASGVPPVRFVIWSWPSDQVCGPLRDVRSKAARSDVDAQLFGWFLSRMDQDAPVALLGYSLGARIISGGLHLMSAGELRGRSLPVENPGRRAPVRVVMMAAALHNHWLLPGRAHGQALEQTDSLLVLYNRSDPVLSRYSWIEPCYNPAALGYTGVVGEHELKPIADRIQEYNVARSVGSSHDENRYFSSKWIVERTRSALFAREPTAD